MEETFKKSAKETDEGCLTLIKECLIPYDREFEDYEIDEMNTITVSKLADIVAGECGSIIYNRNQLENPLANHRMRSPYQMAEFFGKLKFHFPRHKKFLDLGSGTGFPVNLGLKLGYDCCGVDNNKEIISMSKENTKRLSENPKRIIYGNYLEDSFWEKNICGIKSTDFDIFNLFYWPEEMKKIIPKIASKMKSGSHLTLAEWICPVQSFESIKKYLSEIDLKWEENIMANDSIFLRKL